MKKKIFGFLVCFVLLFFIVAVTACSNETEALQEQITALENDNGVLQSTISSLRTELERAQGELSRTQNELQEHLASLEAAQEEQAAQSGGLAITYGGEPNPDMSWPLNYGDLVLGLRLNVNDLDEDVEIIWHSTNEEIFTVVQNEDGTSAVVTPETVGSAQLVVTVGDQETKSWVRVT